MKSNPKYPICIFIWCLLMTFNIHAQVRGITPLHKFMQMNADTTLILEHESGWLSTPKYWLLSKKGDTITAYTYEDSDNRKILMPEAIRQKLIKVHNYAESIDVGVNRFFQAVPISKNELSKLWDKVLKEAPWKINDDTVDGKGCPIDVNKEQFNIDDGGTIHLYLVSKTAIKTLTFYAPSFYEKHCPGRKGRKAILNIDKSFFTFFNPVN